MAVIEAEKKINWKSESKRELHIIFSQLLQHHCSSRESVNVSNLVSLRLHCCCYDNDGGDDITFSLHVAGVTVANAVDLMPISAVPIIPTALARNLQGPLNISDVQGMPKTG